MYVEAKFRYDGKTLVRYDAKSSRDFESFKNNLKAGDVIVGFLELSTDDATLAQFAKVHHLIKLLALHTGNTPSGIKLLVKEKAGLLFTAVSSGEDIVHIDSFANCGIDDLNLAIQACFEIGEQVGLKLE